MIPAAGKQTKNCADWLNSELQNPKRKKILLCSPCPIELLNDWQSKKQERQLVQFTGPQIEPRQKMARFDFCLIAGQLENMDRLSGQTLVGNIRNRYCDHICLWLDRKLAGKAWTDTDLYAMGFTDQHLLLEPSPQCRVTTNTGLLSLYTYSISDYNHKRQWNNPGHWANPQNFNKYRW